MLGGWSPPLGTASRRSTLAPRSTASASRPSTFAGSVISRNIRPPWPSAVLAVEPHALSAPGSQTPDDPAAVDGPGPAFARVAGVFSGQRHQSPQVVEGDALEVGIHACLPRPLPREAQLIGHVVDTAHGGTVRGQAYGVHPGTATELEHDLVRRELCRGPTCEGCGFHGFRRRDRDVTGGGTAAAEPSMLTHPTAGTLHRRPRLTELERRVRHEPAGAVRQLQDLLGVGGCRIGVALEGDLAEAAARPLSLQCRVPSGRWRSDRRRSTT